MIRRPPRSTQSRSSAASDVYKRQRLRGLRAEARVARRRHPALRGAAARRVGREDVLDIDGIKAIIPHRNPFLLVDRIEELEPGVRAVGIKNVTANEDFFAGHFPEYQVMPGVLIVEAM